MWEVTDAAQPKRTFLVFEDAALPTRAELQASPDDATVSRWHAHVVSSEFATLLRHTNLPGPLGTPAGTLGPGAWAQRGATVTFEGLSFRIRLPSSHTGVPSTDGQDECILSIGTVLVGADRVMGGIVEIQFLPLQRLAPSSSLLGSLLVTLLPPTVVPMLLPVVGPAHGALLSASAAPRTMLTPTQLAEVVPASMAAWREAQKAHEASQDPSAFPAWETEPAYPPDAIGWVGSEPRRRMAFVHLAMLRAEGLA